MKRLLFTMSMFAMATISLAQTCDIDYSNNEPGTYPANLPNGAIHDAYNEDLTLVFPQDDNGVDYTLFKLTSLSLPLGLTWECLDNDCTIDPQQDAFTCVNIYGTPAESGTFTVTVKAIAMQGSTESSYTFETEIEIAPSTYANNIFTTSPAKVCQGGTVNFTLNNPINHTPIPGQTTGVTYEWDFGNGNQSTSGTPAPQTYNTIGSHDVEFIQIVDTTGFFLKKIQITAVGCDDAVGFGNPDIYIEIYDGSNNKVYTTESSPNDANLPQTYTLNLALTNPPYKINVMDDDSDNWWGTGDDNCVNGDENDYLVPILLPGVNQTGTTTQAGGVNALSFTYDIHKQVSQNFAMATVQVLKTPDVPVINVESEYPIVLNTEDMGHVYHWNIDGERAHEYTGAEIKPADNGAFTVIAVNEFGCYSTSAEEVVSAVGINNESINSFVMYPNPTSNILNIEFADWMNNSTISVIDISGRIALQTELSNNQNIQLDVSHLNSGMYSVIISKNNEYVSAKKLVIQ